MIYKYVVEITIESDQDKKVVYKQSFGSKNRAVERVKKWYAGLDILERQKVYDCSVCEIGTLEDEEIERLEEQFERDLSGGSWKEIDKEKLIRKVIGLDDLVLMGSDC